LRMGTDQGIRNQYSGPIGEREGHDESATY
jgi:hypothetical protein